jgi:hypothetical protein
MATMSDNTLVNEDTGASENNQAAKTYTQEEFDKHMAGLRASMQKKFEKTLSDLGDIEELKTLKQTAEQAKQEQAMKRGEFERILQESLSKKDLEIQKRDSIIKEYKIDVPLTNAAAKFQAVSAEQVKALLKSNIRLNEEGEVEVVDVKGTVRYSDSGSPLSVDDLVKEFLDSNPHFVRPTAATTATKSSIAANSSGKVDINALDMKNPADRKKYAELKRSGKL